MDVSPVVEFCTLLLPADAFGGITEVAGAASGPNAAASAVGGAGAGTAAGTGGPPGGGSSQTPTVKERLFGSEKATQDMGTSVAQDLAMGVPLEIAGKSLPRATGLLGVLGTLVGASELLFEGIRAVTSTKGLGRGGATKGAQESMREARRIPDGTYRDWPSP